MPHSWIIVLILLCVIFSKLDVLSVTVLHCGWLLLKCSAFGIEFNGAENNCGIAHILGILTMNIYDT